MSIAAAPASAQQRYPGGIFPLYYLDIAPGTFVAAALAQPYGRVMVTEFAAILAESADQKCLTSLLFTKAELPEVAQAILQRSGVQLLATHLSTIDRAAYERYLPARLGKDAIVELARLKTVPKVQAYVAAELPARQAHVLNLIAENLQRVATIKRIKLVRSISPFDNPVVERADPTDVTTAGLKGLVAADTTGDLERYADILRVAQKPFDDAVDMDKLKSFGPADLLAGLEGDLARLCIPGAAP